jgi:hypothetical protein
MMADLFGDNDVDIDIHDSEVNLLLSNVNRDMELNRSIEITY